MWKEVLRTDSTSVSSYTHTPQRRNLHGQRQIQSAREADSHSRSDQGLQNWSFSGEDGLSFFHGYGPSRPPAVRAIRPHNFPIARPFPRKKSPNHWHTPTASAAGYSLVRICGRSSTKSQARFQLIRPWAFVWTHCEVRLPTVPPQYPRTTNRPPVSDKPR